MRTSFTARRWLSVSLVAMLACAVAVSIRPVRHGLLQRAGAFLVTEDDVEPSDAVVLLTGVGSIGALEAIDLLNEGLAHRVVILEQALGREAREFERHGLRPETSAARTIQLLRQGAAANVSAAVITVNVGGTNAEAVAVRRWCLERGIDSIIVITSRDHSARVRRVLRRTFGERYARVLVRIARYDAFDPSDWWQHRDSLRVGIIEIQKLLLEYLRHPIA